MEICIEIIKFVQVELMEIEHEPTPGDHAGLFWRFFVLADPAVRTFHLSSIFMLINNSCR